jgi:AraC-like DNA-binding protein
MTLSGTPTPVHGVLGVVPLIALGEEHGVSRRALLAGTGIAPALLDDPAARIPLDRELALIANLRAAVPDPMLAVRAGRRYPLAFFGLLGTAILAAASLREAVRLALEHLHLTFTPFAVRLIDDRLVFVDQHELGALRRFYLERDVAFVVSAGAQLVAAGAPAVVREVGFDIPAPPEAAAIAAALGVPVAYDRPVTSVALAPAIDDIRSAGHAIAQRAAEEHLRAFGGAVSDADLAARARREIALRVAVEHSLPDEREVARALGVHERTIRRHLDAAGTSFRALAEDVLRAAAIHYLRDSSLAVETIALRLGYAESASFVRAFRRWTGATPHRFRTREGAPRSSCSRSSF